MKYSAGSEYQTLALKYSTSRTPQSAGTQVLLKSHQSRMQRGKMQHKQTVLQHTHTVHSCPNPTVTLQMCTIQFNLLNPSAGTSPHCPPLTHRGKRADGARNPHNGSVPQRPPLCSHATRLKSPKPRLNPLYTTTRWN